VYNFLYIKSEIKFSSNLPLRQGGTKDVVNQQLKELKMNLFKKNKKLELIKIEKGMSKEEIMENLVKMFERQGIKIAKDDKKK
tara:strand:- start:118 stop:366 length:249 start_codon:yes stop_codon:yes gene_type:complete